MIYELTIASRTIRKEGFKPLLQKCFLYFHQRAMGARFQKLKMPHGAPPEEVVAFTFEAAGGLIGPGQIRSEIVQLTSLVQQRRPRVIVEIGTATGGTLCAWCAVADPQALIVSIDLPGGIHGGGYPAWKAKIYQHFVQPGQTLHLLRVDSHLSSTLDSLKSIVPREGIDFLFIDGDHRYEGVKADFDMYSPLVRAGGIVAFHDICEQPPVIDCHVDRLWREVRTKHKAWEYVENPAIGGLGIGVLEM